MKQKPCKSQPYYNHSAGPKGGGGAWGARAGRECPIKKFMHYILRVYTVMHTHKIMDYPHNNSAERKCGRGGTDRSVSVT